MRKFQSTHPVWGATFLDLHHCVVDSHFNPRTPYGVRRTQPWQNRSICSISIHAPRMGCDQPPPPLTRMASHFNPRTPYGVRLPHDGDHAAPCGISIHAPRMGCDKQGGNVLTYGQIFQSTHPVWGATEVTTTEHANLFISIHAPRMGCDCGFIQKNKQFSDIPLYIFFYVRRKPHFRRESRRSSRIFGAHSPNDTPNKPHIRRQAIQKTRHSPKLRCEPLCAPMNASPSHYRMSGSSGR